MLRILALGLTLLVPMAALAADASPAQKAQKLLADMAQASKNLDYQGRFLYQFGGEVSTIEVRHAVFNGKIYQRLTHLDGRISEVLRRGNELLCLRPNGSLTRLTDGANDLLTFRDRLANSIPQQYNVLVDGDGRVAGRSATRIRVAPLDDNRYGYRLWLDDSSDLLLKSEVIDASGTAMERVEFITLNLHPNLKPSDFQMPKVLSEHSLKSLPADRPDRIQVKATWLPGGFEAVDKDWRRVAANQPPVAAQSFSDGLATFTVFVEPIRAQHIEQGVSRVGPTVTISRRMTTDGHDYLVTLVGEIPQPTAEKIMQGIGIDLADDKQ